MPGDGQLFLGVNDDGFDDNRVNSASISADEHSSITLRLHARALAQGWLETGN
jgi:hypothetical protein